MLTVYRLLAFSVNYLRVMLGPYSYKFVEMMWTEDGGIPRQIFKVVHYDSDKQIQHLQLN